MGRSRETTRRCGLFITIEHQTNNKPDQSIIEWERRQKGATRKKGRKEGRKEGRQTNFTRGDTLKANALVEEDLEDGRVGVGLDGVKETVDGGQGVEESLGSGLDRRNMVHILWCL